MHLHQLRLTGRLLIAAVLTLLALGAQAYTVASFSPQGTVSRVQQVVVKFNEDVVRFGDPQAAAPFALHCDSGASKDAQSRWTGPREWVVDFPHALPPGVRCEAQGVADYKSASGGTLKGASRFSFNTGGPVVVQAQPDEWVNIEEQQAFVLQLSGPATAASVTGNVWCDLENVGERVPVQLVTGKERTDILDALHLEKKADKAPDDYYVLRCARRFTAGSKMELVYGAGVASPSGLVTQQEQRFPYRVREPFTFSTSCERENARSGCVPIKPLDVYFSAPVEGKWLEQLRLSAGDKDFQPTFDRDDSDARHVQFAGPFPPESKLKLVLPAGLTDTSGRTLQDVDAGALEIQVAAMPPLAKFSSGSFGIIERFPEAPGEGPALLPLTLRSTDVRAKRPDEETLHLREFTPQGDAEIIRWYTEVQRYDDGSVSRERAEEDSTTPLPPPTRDNPDYVETRAIGLLAGRKDVQTLVLPPAPKTRPRPMEVIGVPVQTGFHVLEVESRVLGEQLLNPDYGASREMYVRTSALVTNLGVHFKLGRANSLAWVTTLDTGKPVAGARVQVSDCRGKLQASATTDADGIATFKDLSPTPPDCSANGNWVGDFQSSYFVSARAQNHGAEDMAFTWSSWQKGIEPWRFNVPTSSSPRPTAIAHTIFDRTLLRAGETVSMKTLIRSETPEGFGLPKKLPTQMTITHVGSGQEFHQPLKWRKTATGGLSAENTFAIPKAAKLGMYEVTLTQPDQDGADRDDDAPRTYDSGTFRVEEFRLPVFQGSVAPEANGPLVASTDIPVQVAIHYINGGAAAELPVQVSATTRITQPSFADWDSYSFSPPQRSDNANDEEDDQQVVADKLRTVLNAQGLGQVTIQGLKPSTQPRHLTIEATYPDPNGEIQTLASSRTLWPAGVVAGIKADSWVSVDKGAPVQVLALDLDGKPKAGVPLDVRALQRVTKTTRKRMVGGFYTYDSHTETTDLGTVCTGKSDDRGMLACNIHLKAPGEIELVAQAHDSEDRVSQAATSIWVTRQGELWFSGTNDDRIDVLPEHKHYEPGDTARLQVRMPFREATALVSVEREGVLHREIVQLKGDDPTVKLKVDPSWGPNVYVSVLALRGRIYDVPWYSFFTWGYKSPREWWDTWRASSKNYVPPTALVDLSKPAFRFGMAELHVGDAAYTLKVDVQPEHPTYQIRDKARVTLQVTQPDGKPAAGADVAVAAVDQALLELQPNDSWKLLQAMMAERPWGVQTATAQMEIVGRRHYGRKAVPAGGGGGKSQTRELFDTLLLWKPSVHLDDQGKATVEVPLNDSLTTFQIVAVADMGTGLFGTGQAAIQTRQNLQIISGLPPLVREGDHFQAMLTLRNSTDQTMQVQVAPQASLFPVAPKTVDIAANAAQTVTWDVAVPDQPLATRTDRLDWDITAKDEKSGAQDRLKVSARVIPAVPIRVRQATLTQIDGFYTQAVTPPADALPAQGPKQGGLALAFQPKLATGLPGVRDWFARYPYTCLEQLTSKAIGMDDLALWHSTLAKLPAYLDRNGLAYYFPPHGSSNEDGSDTLTAYLLSATDEASRINPAWRLPDDVVDQMAQGLSDFIAGRIQRNFWSPRKDLNVRKLAAIAALARYGKARASMLDSLTIAPNVWPTSAVIDWVNVLRRVDGIPQRQQQLDQAMQILRARISVQGTRLIFTTEDEDNWWWLMDNADVNAARLLLTVLDDPAWQDDLPRLVTGFIARQKSGAWSTTTANLWGSLALQQFSRTHEREPVTGETQASYAGKTEAVHWAQVKPVKEGVKAPFSSYLAAPSTPGQLTGNQLFFPWPANPESGSLVVTQAGSGQPWLTLQSLAAVRLTEPVASGYRIRKTITPVEQANKQLPAGHYTRGDILRVKLEISADASMTWVAVTDPVVSGATILGGGLGRDSSIATSGETSSGNAWPAFEERTFEAFRSYYQYLPKGQTSVEYTVRLNNAGTFQLPATRVEALYAPEMFGEAPNADVVVEP